MNGPDILFPWLTFSILIFAFLGLILFLAFKAGYFRDQDRARHLALWAEVPEKEQKNNK